LRGVARATCPAPFVSDARRPRQYTLCPWCSSDHALPELPSFHSVGWVEPLRLTSSASSPAWAMAYAVGARERPVVRARGHDARESNCRALAVSWAILIIPALQGSMGRRYRHAVARALCTGRLSRGVRR